MFNEQFNKLKQTYSQEVTRALCWRKEQLLALKRCLVERENEFVEALNKDLGKSYAEAYTTEIGFLLAEIRHTLKHLSGWLKVKRVSTPLAAWPAKSFIQPEPLGTVLIMGAWNYPLQLTVGPYIAALAAGNCAILKPSELSPHTSAAMAKYLPQYLDNDALAVIEGDKEVASALLDLPFDHIFYTGGELVGKVVMAAAAKHLTPVTLELGGKSPCIVGEDTNIEVTARRIVWGKWLNAGQTCVAPDYVLVSHANAQALKTALIAEIKQQFGDNPLMSPDLGTIVNERHFQRLRQYLIGEDVICGGDADTEALKLAPTIVWNPSIDSPVMTEEIFGPILPIIVRDDLDTQLQLVKRRAKPLALYLFSHSQDIVDKVVQHTSSGSVCVNDVMMFMTNPELPFGGVGNSGMGRYHGKAGFDTFSHHKPVMHRRFAFDVPFRYAPMKKWKFSLLKRLLK